MPSGFVRKGSAVHTRIVQCGVVSRHLELFFPRCIREKLPSLSSHVRIVLIFRLPSCGFLDDIFYYYLVSEMK
jgi:hypothetical protein